MTTLGSKIVLLLGTLAIGLMSGWFVGYEYSVDNALSPVKRETNVQSITQEPIVVDRVEDQCLLDSSTPALAQINTTNAAVVTGELDAEGDIRRVEFGSSESLGLQSDTLEAAEDKLAISLAHLDSGALAELFSHPNVEFRRQVIDSLGIIGDAESVRLLGQVLFGENNTMNRIAAIHQLQTLGHIEITRNFLEAAYYNDESPAVRQSAYDALE